MRLKPGTNLTDTRVAFTRHTIPDRGRLTQSEVGKRLSGKDSVKRKWLAAVNLRLSNRGGRSWQTVNNAASRQIDMDTTFDITTTGRATMSLQKSCENTGISNGTDWR